MPSAGFGTRCWSSSVMENWEGRLRSVFEGVCCLCGCGGAYCVCVDGAFEELVDAAGVRCPHGSEL